MKNRGWATSRRGLSTICEVDVRHICGSNGI